MNYPAGAFAYLRRFVVVTFPNPPARLVEGREALGTIWEAARVAGVKPGTIRVWLTRGRIERMDLGDNGPELFHLPTVYAASPRARAEAEQQAPRAA